MKISKRLRLSTGLLSLVVFFACSRTVLADSSVSGFIYNQTYQSLNPASLTGIDQSEQSNRSWSGSFQYDVPITLPPGRNNFTPTLNLHYDNQATDQASWLSKGWSVSIPSIKRLNIYGIDSMYTRTDFSSSNDGKLQASGTSYVAETDNGSNATYTYNSDGSWTVTDKIGTTYTYGATTDSRLDNSADTSTIYAWYLSSVTDPNGNDITYTYTKDQNQIYPDTITYADHFTVQFGLGSRDDQLTRFDTGFQVRTYYVITDISVRVDGTTVHDYALDYDKPSDGRELELLHSITETGYDSAGTATALPATTFTYQTGTGGWPTKDTSFSTSSAEFAYYSTTTVPTDSGGRMFDVNGDDLADIVYATDDYSSAASGSVWINTGSAWAQDTAYVVPIGFIDRGMDIGTRVADVNGDGYLDLIKSYGGTESSHYESNGVYINHPESKTWTLDTSYSIPMNFVVNPGSTPQDTTAKLVDVNGDNLPDFVAALESNSGVYSGSDSVSINNGHGWTDDSAYVIPIPIGRQMSGGTAQDLGVQFSDVNNDGLVDLLNGTEGVYINQGSSKTWAKTSGYSLPGSFVSYAGSINYDSGLRLLDINGDHYDDIAGAMTASSGHYDGTSFTTYLNYNDQGWFETTDSDYPIPVGFVQQGTVNVDEGTRFGDVDGDGLVDLVKAMGSESDNGVYLNQGNVADMLTNVSLPTGGNLAMTYDTATPSANPNLPYPVEVVKTITKNDGLGNSNTTTYTYSGGAQYGSSVEDRQFAGFSTITEQTTNRQLTYHYNQGTDHKQKIGKISEVDIANASDVTIAQTFTTWDVADNFVYPSQAVTLYYNSDGTHYDTGITYSYDTSTDNLLITTDYGKVIGTTSGTFTDTTGDTYTTTNTYATPTSGSAVTNKIVTTTLTNNAGTQLQQTRYKYDSLSEGSVTTGNVTSKKTWIGGTSYAETTYTYTSYGLVATITDPLSHTTTNTYDANYLQPTTVTDALSHSIIYSYDLDSGLVSSTTDPNGLVTTTTYDGLNRPIEKDQASAAVTTWSYDMASVPNQITTMDWLDASNAREHYTYVDGFGRTIQQRDEMATADTWSVTDTSYNAEGLTSSTSLPYSATGSARSTATTDTTLLSQTTYDPLNRPTSIVTALGTTTHTYANWQDTVVDTAGKTKVYQYDPHNQLTNVIETISGTNYTTTYTLDGSNLTKITDASNNVRNFTYDGRGLQLTGQDLHGATDTAYGSTTSTFNDNGQLSTFTDANGNVTTSTYDADNRLLTKGDETYTYDTCTNGIGRLCSVSVGSDVTTAYNYDTLGRVSNETKTIKGTVYTTAYTYDRQNNQLTITYPDASITTFTYNSAGQVATTTFYDGRKSTTTTLVSAVSYSPIGKPSSITYGSGSVTTNTYDAAKLYRLSNKTTTNGSITLQNLDYTYDANDDITGITDAASIYSGITYTYTYDDVYRLKTSQATQGTTSLYNLSYNYSAIGNLTSATGLGTYIYGGTAAGNYANPHATTRIMGKTYSYDHNGNLTSDGTWTNTWNSKNQLTNQVNGTLSYAYSYDHSGNRAYKTKVNGTTTTVSVYPNDYYDIEGAYYRRHISHPTLGSIATNTYFSTRRTSTLTYHLTDHLGSTTVDTNSTGTYQEYVIYYPFGKIKTDFRIAGAVNDDYKFTGQELDDTNLYYYGARYYNPTYYIFLSQDPGTPNLSNPQTFNNYGYALNNPVNFNDPDGKTAVNWSEVGVGVVTIIIGVVGAVTGVDEVALGGMAAYYAVSGGLAGIGAGLVLSADGLGGNNKLGFAFDAANFIDYASDTPLSPSQMSTLVDGINHHMPNSNQPYVWYPFASHNDSSSNSTTSNQSNISNPTTAPVTSTQSSAPTQSSTVTPTVSNDQDWATQQVNNASTYVHNATFSQQFNNQQTSMPHNYIDSPTSMHSSSFAKQSSHH